MKLNELIFETEILELTQALFEKPGEGNNNIVKAWAKKLDMSYDELHQVWEKAEKAAGGPKKYGLIVHIFKRMVTSMKGATKKTLKDGGKGKFDDYKIRTKQTKKELLDDKPAPKSAKPAEVKKAKAKISKINAQMRDIKAKPANTPTRKARIKKQLEELRAKKKEIQASIK